MKISYETNTDDIIYVKQNDIVYQLYPDEVVYVGENYKNDEIVLYTNKNTKLGLFNIVLLFMSRMFLNVFNILLMNYRERWYDDLNPFTIYVTYTSKTEMINIKYISGQVLTNPIRFQRPMLLINNILIDIKSNINTDEIQYRFLEHCFDLASVWIYGSVPLAVIGIYSEKLLTGFIPCFSVIIGTAIALILKASFEFNGMKKMLDYISDNTD